MRFRPEQHLRRQTTFAPRGNREPPRIAAPSPSGGACGRRKADGFPPRAAVVASIAAVGNAVQRNRAKRRLREIFRRHQGSLPRDCALLLIARARGESPVVRGPGKEICRKPAASCASRRHLPRSTNDPAMITLPVCRSLPGAGGPGAHPALPAALVSPILAWRFWRPGLRLPVCAHLLALRGRGRADLRRPGRRSGSPCAGWPSAIRGLGSGPGSSFPPGSAEVPRRGTKEDRPSAHSFRCVRLAP